MTDTGSAKDAPTAECTAEKPPSDKECVPPQVHSANAWEKADLGDEDRKNKFLRLMGAGKKEHHGRVVIGDHTPEHLRKSQETDKIQNKLLEQYEQSMQHRLAGGRRGHIGLGFHDADKEQQDAKEGGDDDKKSEDKDNDDDNADDADEQAEKDEENDKDDGDKEDKSCRKRESTEKSDEASPEKKAKIVKGSS